MKKVVKEVIFGKECVTSGETREVTVTQQQQGFGTTTQECEIVCREKETVQPTTNIVPPVIEHKERAPVLQEVVKPTLREEIQPVVHREREQREIREVVQPIYEKQVRPTVIEEKMLQAEYRPELRTGVMQEIREVARPMVNIEETKKETIMKPPIVEETIKKTIVEEVTPVIHRETLKPTIIREVKPIYEKIVEAPIISYMERPATYTTEAYGQKLFTQQRAFHLDTCPTTCILVHDPRILHYDACPPECRTYHEVCHLATCPPECTLTHGLKAWSYGGTPSLTSTAYTSSTMGELEKGLERTTLSERERVGYRPSH